MKKMLFCNVPYSGHIYPTLPVVRELVGQGIEVVYCITDEFRDVVQSTGARVICYRSTLLSSVRGDSSQGPQYTARFINESQYVFQQILQTVKDERPDLVIYEEMCIWGRFLAVLLEVPAIKISTAMAPNEHYNHFDYYNKLKNIPFSGIFISPELRNDMEHFCRRYKLPPIEFVSIIKHIETCNIVFMPRKFQIENETFDNRFTFVGPAISSVRPTTDFPWEQLDSKPICLVSLGSINNSIAGIFDICLTALGNQPQQVAMAIGDKIDPILFGELPGNVIMRRFLPQLELLQRTEVFISHAGTNSVAEALYFGVPMIVMPQTPEQFITARRVEELHLGIYIENVTAHQLRVAVQQIREDETYRQNTQAMAHEIQQEGGYQKAVEVILNHSS